MKRKFVVSTMLMILIVGVTVGMLVLAQPKEAKADVWYSITVYVNFEDPDDPPIWNPLQTLVSFTINQVYSERTTDQLSGTAWCSGAAVTDFTAVVEDGDWAVVDPITLEQAETNSVVVYGTSHTFYVMVPR